ncbi:MAG: endonuclease VIII [Sandaracinaceae bacterium]|nr:endonuclease VIII [Myxococcales bacterium]
MPEGPETRRAADRVAAAVAGQVAEEVFFAFPHLQGYAEELSGRRVESVVNRGKAILTAFDIGLTVYTHNQLYGRWFVTARGRTPRTSRSLRFAIHAAEKSAWLYSASEIVVLESRDLKAHPYLAKLGPDVSAGELDPVIVRERLRDSLFSGRQLAGLYLDQEFLAGLGNYLRAEILFHASAHPRARPRDLPAAQIRRLAASTVEICRRAHAARGVTLSPRLASRAKRARGSERRFYVYGRAGKPCRRCGTPITREPIGGRHIYYCASCQRR